MSGRLFERELTAAWKVSGWLFDRESTAAWKVSGRFFKRELTAALKCLALQQRGLRAIGSTIERLARPRLWISGVGQLRSTIPTVADILRPSGMLNS